MIQVHWQDQLLDVRRLVFRRGFAPAFDAVLDRVAGLFHLDVADDRAEPLPGDFWIGCHPRGGWGNADPNLTGWASIIDAPAAVSVLRRTAARAAPSAPQTVPHTPTLAVAFG
ncbi:hypothetical protein [Frigoriglobus tundricola]|uniref:Uncharacterized protein n=1 Tax=Frigoriglobus tundricola TaxID=2774151 RepID=A0A6M5YZV0_9BACT|nr:hypothetical protein [Frigoriglobus tundricola]QJW98940.1 hypothetical protein FTUN_6535 [Frigoriglobus tundricola]